jgi:hypothetical protein
MSSTFLALVLGTAVVVIILLTRRLRRRDPGGYRRRFNDTASRHDEAFPYASTLYVGDGSPSQSHHQPAADCAQSSDAGAGCSDGGSGSH